MTICIICTYFTFESLNMNREKVVTKVTPT